MTLDLQEEGSDATSDRLTSWVDLHEVMPERVLAHQRHCSVSGSVHGTLTSQAILTCSISKYIFIEM